MDKRTLSERAPIEGAVTRAQTALNLATAKVEKSRLNLSDLSTLALGVQLHHGGLGVAF